MATVSTGNSRPAGIDIANSMQAQPTLYPIPATQKLLLLHGKGQEYQITAEGELPRLAFGDLLVEIHAIGLNPIDWKSAAFGFGLPQLPSINGREFVGKIIASEVETECDLVPGEWVLAVSTDYRDFRKAAFQEYAIVCCYNATRIPPHIDPFRVASVGVAYVAAGLALGVCLGVSFTKNRTKRAFNLLEVAQKYPEDVPEDILPQIVQGISPGSRPYPGEWVLIYGASSVTAQITTQLAKLAGLKVVGVADLKKHRALLESLGTDLLIDRTNLEDAEREIRRLVPGSLRFAIDTVGSDTAAWCQNVLAARTSSRYSSPTNVANGTDPLPVDPESRGGGSKLSHLVVLTGAPKTSCPNVQVHQVPIKLFHSHKKIGGHLSKWLFELLENGTLKLPEVEFVDGGLDVVNTALQRLKDGDVSGRRLVVRTKENGPNIALS